MGSGADRAAAAARQAPGPPEKDCRVALPDTWGAGGTALFFSGPHPYEWPMASLGDI